MVGNLVKCPFCNCYFANERDLQLHIWALHTGRPLRKDEKERRRA